MNQNSNNAGTYNLNVNPANESQVMTIKVECLIYSKILYWTAGLATGTTIGIAAYVAWKMVRYRKH